MRKKNLQEVTDYKLMTVGDALMSLGFTWEDTSNRYENIRCSCGELAKLWGFWGCESISCETCKKEILDVSSPIVMSNSTVGIIDFEEYEPDNPQAFWIAIDGKGGIKYGD